MLFASSLDEAPVLKRSFLKSLAPGADTFPEGDLRVICFFSILIGVQTFIWVLCWMALRSSAG